jgi:simple sugar transport system permease protein
MTTTSTSAGLAETTAPPTAPVHDGRRLLRVVAGVVAAVVVLSIVRDTTKANDHTSSGTFSAGLAFAVPLLLVGLGALFSERAGVVNIGVEGMMILGTWFGAYGAWKWGPWWGFAFGALGGMLGGLIHAVATVTFGVDHIISGVAINFFGPGVARFLSDQVFTGHGGGATQSPQITSHVGYFDVPVLSGGWGSPNFFGWLERQRWFLLSDLGGILGGLTRHVSWMSLIAVAMIPGSAWLLWRTAFGLRLRSAGENPTAAETLGVPVYTMKYAGVLMSGALAGLGGAFLAIENTGIYREGQTAGRGFIGLAAMIFGNWHPLGTAAGAGLFGYADVLQLRSEKAVHSLLLFIGVAAALFAIGFVLRRKVASTISLVLTAALFFVWYAVSAKVPVQLVPATPYVLTLLLLVFTTQRLRPPAADGLRYRKGTGH